MGRLAQASVQESVHAPAAQRREEALKEKARRNVGETVSALPDAWEPSCVVLMRNHLEEDYGLVLARSVKKPDALEVREVYPETPAGIWNVGRPALAVEKGDLIWQVNDAEGAEDMLATYQRSLCVR